MGWLPISPSTYQGFAVVGWTLMHREVSLCRLIDIKGLVLVAVVVVGRWSDYDYDVAVVQM